MNQFTYADSLLADGGHTDFAKSQRRAARNWMLVKVAVVIASAVIVTNEARKIKRDYED